MALDFFLVEPAFADPFLLDMDHSGLFPLPLAFRMDEGVFDHFEPLWKFLRTQGLKCQPLDDFLILPEQIVAARDKMNSLWSEIHRTRPFFHPDADPFWAWRDLLESVAKSGSGLIAYWD